MPTDTLSLLLELFPVNVALDQCADGVPFVLACQDGARIRDENGALKRFDAGSIAIRQCSSTEKPWEFHHGSAHVERLVAGKFCFHRPEKNLLLAHMPAQALVDSETTELRGLAMLLNMERHHAALGRDAAIRSISSILFPLMIRSWLMAPHGLRGVYALLSDAELSPSLHCMLSEPHRPWTLESLAKVCRMSRANFGRRFPLVAKETPADLLTQLRMARAALKLREGNLPVADIGNAVGYQSLAAFNRKFKALAGIGPGQYRREARLPR